MHTMDKSGGLVSEDSMEIHGISCSSPYCSFHRMRRAQSVSEGHDDILNASPRLSDHYLNICVDRRLHDQNSLCILEKASQSSSSNYMASTGVSLPKSAAELIKEISTLEYQVEFLERSLLSLYRTAFDQYLASSPSSTIQTSSTPIEWHPRPLVQDSSRILTENQASPSVNSYHIDNRMDQCQSLERTEMKRNINCNGTKDSPAHDTETGSDLSPDESQSLERTEMKRNINCNGTKDSPAHDTETGSDLSPREGPKYDEPKSIPSLRTLANLLGASIADHVPQTPSKLSEDIIRCISAIYCKLASSPMQQMDIPTSPSPSASSSSTLSPRDVCDSWSPRCHYEAATSSSSFDSSKDKKSPYRGMVEVAKISLDGDRFGYASKMLHIFRSLIRRLEKINPEKMDHEDQLSFWINIHNALVMHAFLAYGLHENQMKSTFSIQKAAYDIGGHSVNAHVIQSSILGCQLHRRAFGLRVLWSPPTKLKKGKDKHPYALKYPEPLAHFALCLGAYSDPPVRVYTAKSIYKELKLAKEEFIQANAWIQKETKIVMPRILCYYAKDASLELSAIVEMVSDCMSEDVQKSIRGCLLRRKLDKCVEWSPYKPSFRYLVHRDLAKH